MSNPIPSKQARKNLKLALRDATKVTDPTHSLFLEQIEINDNLDKTNETLSDIKETGKESLTKLVGIKEAIEGSDNATLAKILNRVTLLKGDKGDSGERPTTEELLELIIPLIPEPIKGDQGDIGPIGPKGQSGYTPVKGTDYFDGKNGINGKDGRDGKDAEFKPKEFFNLFLEFIKSLPNTKKPEITDLIRNGQQFMSGLGERGSKYKLTDQRWHGAGANVATDTYTTTGGLQTITLSHTPVAILLVNLNGQVLSVAGGDYTVSGNKVNLLNVNIPAGEFGHIAYTW